MTTPKTIKSITQEEITAFLKSTKKSHFYRRVQFIQYKKQGMTHKRISSLLNVCIKTLSNWMKLFSEGGLPKLVSVSYDRRTSKLCAIEKEIRQEVSQGKVPTQAACRDWIKKQHAINMSLSATGWFLKKNGIVLQKDEASPWRDA